MKADEIRETYLSFFEERGHQRSCPRPRWCPSVHDPSVLLTTAGMQPFKPYFLGPGAAAARRGSPTCQKCFRTTDIEEVGNTARHLTFFEMLGNFELRRLLQGGVDRAGAGSSRLEGFGFDPERIWITVFEGDDELGLGPDEEAIEIWRAVGVPDERIVRLPRSENFWQAGPTGPCGPCSELYLDRGARVRRPRTTCPGDDTERFLEYWNLVFMQLRPGRGRHARPSCRSRTSTPAWASSGWRRSSRTSPRSSRPTALRPLIELAEELSGRSLRRRTARRPARCGSSPTTRAATPS